MENNTFPCARYIVKHGFGKISGGDCGVAEGDFDRSAVDSGFCLNLELVAAKGNQHATLGAFGAGFPGSPKGRWAELSGAGCTVARPQRA